MTRFRSGRASSSTNALVGWAGVAALVLAAALPAAELPPLATLRAVEFETALAREPRIYLVLAPSARELRVKSRGMTLASVALLDLTVLHFQPLFGGGEPPELLSPTVWKVRQGPGDTDRETIAPVTLRPYSEDEEQEEPAAGTQPAKPKGEDEKPSTYRVALEGGWQLLVTDDPPELGFFRRFAASVRDGWLRFQGQEPAHPPLVTLVLERDSAQRLHHLFRTGTEILVLP